MDRKCGLRFITLTLNDENKSLTDDTAKKYIKKLLDALKDKSKRERWSYKIWVYFSREEMKPDKIASKFIIHEPQVKRPHFHVILYAIPCFTIERWMRNYWDAPGKSKRKKLGFVHSKYIWDVKGVTNYCNNQKRFKERVQSYAGAETLNLDLISNYEIEREIGLSKPL